MDKYIFKKDAVLFENESKHCIEYLESTKDSTEDNRRGYFYTSLSLGCDEFQFLKNILITNINEYVKQHSFLSILYAPWTLDERFHIQKYTPGNSYSDEHMEHGKDDHDSKRLLGWMIYLNDIKNNGGTCWPQQNFISTPRRVDLYIWPAGWTHSHYGIAAPEEIKYIITGWCEFI